MGAVCGTFHCNMPQIHILTATVVVVNNNVAFNHMEGDLQTMCPVCCVMTAGLLQRAHHCDGGWIVVGI